MCSTYTPECKSWGCPPLPASRYYGNPPNQLWSSYYEYHFNLPRCDRDFDRVLVDNVVRPWLLENFDLPEGFSVNPSFKSLLRLAIWATERAKIELSAREDSVISLSETEAGKPQRQ